MPAHAVALVPHPNSQDQWDFEINVQYHRSAKQLELRYRILGEIAGLNIPASRPVARKALLWQHLCCEVFVRQDNQPDYLEYNFSPSGEWAHYRFENYRSSPLEPACEPPPIHCEIDERSLDLYTKISLPHSKAVTLGLSVILENHQGELSYWALKHPAHEPDFHHPDAFSLKLE